MSDDLENGGIEEPEDVKVPPRDRRRLMKQVLAIVVGFSVILASLGIWFAYFDHKTIDEIGERHLWMDGGDGFEGSLAGTTLVLEGEVTRYEIFNTTLGTLSFIELDGNREHYLVKWGDPSFSAGDKLVTDVHFEWSRYNDFKSVLSPQLNHRVLDFALDSERVLHCFGGICLSSRNDNTMEAVIVEVFLPMGQGFPLSLFNASIKRGVTAHGQDRDDLNHGYSNNPELDHITALDSGIGENGILEFTDANSNGLLDDGDYFTMDLAPPSEDSAIQSYLLQVNEVLRTQPLVQGVLAGSAYIAMTNKGLLKFLPRGIEFGSHYGGRFEIGAEYEDSDGTSTEIVVVEVRGSSPHLLERGTCALNRHPPYFLGYTSLKEGKVALEENTSIEFSDTNKDGHLNAGDTFTISGLEKWTKYTLEVSGYPEDFRNIAITWRTGMGAYTGHVPVIEWRNPEPLDAPVNSIYKLQIDKMYGIPDVQFEYKSYAERFRVEVDVDGAPLVAMTFLEANFSLESFPLEITFYDADNNSYVNAGDYFIVEASNPVEVELTLHYGRTPRYGTGGGPIISWPISWETH